MEYSLATQDRERRRVLGQHSATLLTTHAPQVQ